MNAETISVRLPGDGLRLLEVYEEFPSPKEAVLQTLVAGSVWVWVRKGIF